MNPVPVGRAPGSEPPELLDLVYRQVAQLQALTRTDRTGFRPLLSPGGRRVIDQSQVEVIRLNGRPPRWEYRIRHRDHRYVEEGHLGDLDVVRDVLASAASRLLSIAFPGDLYDLQPLVRGLLDPAGRETLDNCLAMGLADVSVDVLGQVELAVGAAVSCLSDAQRAEALRRDNLRAAFATDSRWAADRLDRMEAAPAVAAPVLLSRLNAPPPYDTPAGPVAFAQTWVPRRTLPDRVYETYTPDGSLVIIRLLDTVHGPPDAILADWETLWDRLRDQQVRLYIERLGARDLERVMLEDWDHAEALVPLLGFARPVRGR